MTVPLPKYGRIERERRFLLRRFPPGAAPERIRRITDHYIAGTSLRLRQIEEDDRDTIHKLTQKIRQLEAGSQQGWITTIHLTRDEFDILEQLPAHTLRKTRYSIPPFGVDVFEGPLEGLVLAEAEFDSGADAAALVIPPFLFCEVSDDSRFTGGRLVRASREELFAWLAEFGLVLE